MQPREWKTVKLENVLSLVQYGTSLPSSDDGNVLVVGMKNLSEGSITFNDCPKIKMKEQAIEKLKLMKGDILLNRTNSAALVGKVGIFRENSLTAVFASYLVRLRCNTEIVEPEFLNYWLNSSSIQKQLKGLATRAVSQANINPTIAKKRLAIILPSLTEQKAIAAILLTWDEAIEKTERLIQLKESSFQNLLALKIYNHNFKRKKLGRVIQEVSQRNQTDILRVLSVTNHSGFVLPEEQFSRRVASQNLENYKVVCKGQYAYNPSRINVGSIARLDQWDIGVLSPMYVVFKIEKTAIHSDFLYYWLQTKEARKRICASTQGSVRESVNYNDFASLSIPLPELKVQEKIICEMNLIEEELNNLKNTKEKIILQKQGLMQKLLTGKWRVNFKE